MPCSCCGENPRGTSARPSTGRATASSSRLILVLSATRRRRRRSPALPCFRGRTRCSASSAGGPWTGTCKLSLWDLSTGRVDGLRAPRFRAGRLKGLWTFVLFARGWALPLPASERSSHRTTARAQPHSVWRSQWGRSLIGPGAAAAEANASLATPRRARARLNMQPRKTRRWTTRSTSR